MLNPQKETTKGGFLLGTDEATYRKYIQNNYALSAVFRNQVIGFGIIFPNHIVRNTELWEKRQLVDWKIDIKELEQKKICYFEQLAFLRGHRRKVITLAYNLIHFAFQKGHEVLLTTTVQKPILNLAAVPFIMAVNGAKVGEIDEIYPIVGQIKSDIYQIKSTDFYAAVKKHALYPFLKSTQVKIS